MAPTWDVPGLFFSGLTVWAYLYAYDSNLDLSNTEADANFLTAEEMLRIFQSDGDGTPVIALQDEGRIGLSVLQKL